MPDTLRKYIEQLEILAREDGLDFYPVSFESVPPAFMTEVAVYGLPVRMPHWSFGVRYIYQLIQHRMGHSRLFEVVFPGNPSQAYLANTNSLAENTLVAAHVLGHADFSRNNALFRRSHDEVGHSIVEHAAAQARQIAEAIRLHGQDRVEATLDAALALEQHIDVHMRLRRDRYPEAPSTEDRPGTPDVFLERFQRLGVPPEPEPERVRRRMPIPPRKEQDLLWFIAQYAPDMDGWERDIFLAVRQESFYFHPVAACQIMNEGWASYWHAHLLRRAEFLPQHLYIDALKTHSDVVRPYAGERQVALAINPYHVGFRMWERIIEEVGVEAARRIMHAEDDFGFVRNFLDAELAEELQLFRFTSARSGEVHVEEHDLDALREAILAPKFNFGAPRVYVSEMKTDGTLVLRHDYEIDGRGLDLARAAKVMAYVQRVWRRKVLLHTADEKGQEVTLAEQS